MMKVGVTWEVMAGTFLLLLRHKRLRAARSCSDLCRLVLMQLIGHNYWLFKLSKV